MNAYAATRTLFRAHLRRDRVLLVTWIAAGSLLYVSQAASVEKSYPNRAALEEAASAMSANAAMIALTGPARALDTVGGQVAWQSAAYGAVVAGLMSMLLVGRHTRQEEETGRGELVRAGSVGGLAPAASAVLLAVAANIALGALVAVGLVGYGLPVTGSLALGVALTTTGWVFTGVAVAAAQTTVTTRSAYALTVAVIGVSFVLRGLGDAGPEAVSWLSPIGWGQATRPYADEQWWPLVLPVAATAALLGLAMWLHSRRDYGAAPWSARASEHTDEDLRPWGLAWRLQRGTVLGWSAALFLMGLGYGALAQSADNVVGDSGFAETVVIDGASATDGFLGTVLLLLALLATGAGVMAAARPDTEERTGRLDHLLAGQLPRLSWSLQHTILAVIAVAAALAAGGVGTGIGHAATTQDPDALLPPVIAALSYLPALLVVTALVRLAHSLSWNAARIGWCVLAWCAFAGMFAGVMDLPELLVGLSPFDHVATLPVESFAGQPWAALWAVALAVGAAAQTLLARRDLR